MEEKVKNDILHVLRDSLKAIREDDAVKLKEISDHIIHDVSIYQDEYSISLAVIIYAVAKIFERIRYREYRTWGKFHRAILGNLNKAYDELRKDNVDGYEYHFHKIVQDLNKVEEKFRKYIAEVIESAKISKASRVHEHGISTGRTAELLGISEWELMDYVGETGIADVKYSISKPIIKRIKLIRGLFK